MIYPAVNILYYYAHPVNSDVFLVVYDIIGRKMEEFELSGSQNQIEIDVFKFPAGIYVALLQNENGVISRNKFVVR